MSDVIWASAIAVMGSALSGGIAAWAGARVARGQQGVEIRRIVADRDRLRDQFHEEERRGRQSTYLRLLAVLSKWDMYGTGWPPRDDETFEATLMEFNALHGAVLLLGEDDVTDALGPIIDQLGVLGSAMARARGDTVWQRFANGYPDHRDALIAATAQLEIAMRKDVNLVTSRSGGADS